MKCKTKLASSTGDIHYSGMLIKITAIERKRVDRTFVGTITEIVEPDFEGSDLFEVILCENCFNLLSKYVKTRPRKVKAS